MTQNNDAVFADGKIVAGVAFAIVLLCNSAVAQNEVNEGKLFAYVGTFSSPLKDMLTSSKTWARSAQRARATHQRAALRSADTIVRTRT